MGNIAPCSPGVGAGQRAGGGPGEVQGVLHLLTPADHAELARAEHEYRPVVVGVEVAGPVPGASGGSAAARGGASAVPAVAFVTPEARCIRAGLPPIRRYLGLLVVSCLPRCDGPCGLGNQTAPGQV